MATRLSDMQVNACGLRFLFGHFSRGDVSTGIEVQSSSLLTYSLVSLQLGESPWLHAFKMLSRLPQSSNTPFHYSDLQSSNDCGHYALCRIGKLNIKALDVRIASVLLTFA